MFTRKTLCAGMALAALLSPLAFMATPVEAQNTKIKITEAMKNPPKLTAEDKEKLPVNPRLIEGKLENGMKYWIMPNGTPKDRVSLYLHVSTGSLNETDEERGLAHYLEHMAFNGSENFKPGELIKSFESMGMRFGAQMNAFTSFDQTTYTMDMPDSKKETIDKGLLGLSDYAYRMLLLPEEIDKERGVILEEKRSRSGMNQRIIDQLFPQIFPGSRISERLPIGTEEVIKRVKREDFVKYYKRWYRPDNTTLIVVGEVKPDEVKGLIEKHFKAWEPTTGLKMLNYRAGINLPEKPRVILITDKELPAVYVSIDRFRYFKDMQTVGDYRRRLIEQLGTAMLNRRLAKLYRSGKAPWQGASVSVQDEYRSVTGMGANMQVSPEKMEEALALLIKEIKAARTYGFLDSEYEQVKKSILSARRAAVKRESTTENGALISMLNSNVSAERYPMSAQQGLELYERVIKDITLEEIKEAFVKNFSPGNRQVTVLGPEDFKYPSKEEILAFIAKSEQVEVTPPQESKTYTTFLDKLPEAGKVATETYHKEADTTSVMYENGILLHIKSMDQQKDAITLQLTIPGSVMVERQGYFGITSLAMEVFNQPASATRDSNAISDLRSGKNFSINGSDGMDAATVTLTMNNEDAEAAFQLLHLLMTQGELEDSAVDKWKESVAQGIETDKTDVQSQTFTKLDALITNNDPRWASLTEKDLTFLNKENAQRFLQMMLASSPIEACIVGDIDLEKAKELSSKYLGSLPKRDRKGMIERLNTLRVVNIEPGTKSATIEVPTITNLGWVVFGWRGTNYTDVRERRLMSIVSSWLTKPLRDEIREKRGWTYSTFTSYRSGEGFDGTSLLMGGFTADPENAERALKVAKETLLKKLEAGPTQEEIDTLHKQFENSISQAQKRPNYWVWVLSSLQTSGLKLDDVVKAKEFYTSFTAEDMVNTAKKYVTEDRFLSVIAYPENAATTAPATQTAE